MSEMSNHMIMSEFESKDCDYLHNAGYSDTLFTILLRRERAAHFDEKLRWSDALTGIRGQCAGVFLLHTVALGLRSAL